MFLLNHFMRIQNQLISHSTYELSDFRYIRIIKAKGYLSKKIRIFYGLLYFLKFNTCTSLHMFSYFLLYVFVLPDGVSQCFYLLFCFMCFRKTFEGICTSWFRNCVLPGQAFISVLPNYRIM